MVTHPRDLKLVQRCIEGEAAARDELGRRFEYVSRIVSARNRRLQHPLDPDLVADVAGEVVLLALRKLSEFNGYAALESWLYAFCEFTLLNTARRTRREQSIPLETEPATIPGIDLDGERLQLALQRLPSEELGAVRLKHYDGLTFEDIAERLQIPLTTAKGRYYRAIQRLRYWLGGSEHEEGQ